MNKILAFLILLAASAWSQTFNYQFSFGEFNTASSFYMSQSGYLYITDTGTDEVYKYDTLGTLIKEAGGYGWQENNFDDPFDVFATPLNVYVCDHNNHRVARYDKDLNYISSLTTHDSDNPDEQFGYPLSCAVSPQGDLYILDSENRRIVKFDLFGNFIQNFGGMDAGDYALSSPLKLAVSPVGNVYVLEKNRIVVFDQYGNGISAHAFPGHINGMNITFNNMALNSRESVYTAQLNSADISFNPVTFTGIDKIMPLQTALLYNGRMFLLTDNSVLVFAKSGND